MFADVIPCFEKWVNEPFFIKLYTFASGPVEIQKLFLSATTQGDAAKYLTSGFDAHHTYKYNPNKYKGVLASLAEREAKNLFYFTDSPRKGNAALQSGMTVFIVLREGNKQYSEKKLKPFQVIKTFEELEFYEFE